MNAKAAASRRVNEVRDQLIDLSHRIHANPELGYEEEKSSAWVSEALASDGFEVKSGVCDLPTAFTASYGSGPLHVALCAEYDALPGIGHACGHNVIAASAVGAAAALRAVADDVGLTVTVVGTPAEEGGGGKIKLLEGGAFRGMHAAMMVHPAPMDALKPPMIAVSHFEVNYTGRDAHASAFPELGINAADAITVAQIAIGLLRQQLRPSDRVHGIITNGGDAPNIIPSHTSAFYYVRAASLDELDDVKQKVINCFEAGALATGATLKISEPTAAYAEMHHDSDIAALYRRNSEVLGRKFNDDDPRVLRPSGSTDMGNVSVAMPSIHPFIGIDSLPAVNHQPEFAAHCARPSADAAMADGALAMAWTCIDMASNKSLRERLITQASVS